MLLYALKVSSERVDCNNGLCDATMSPAHHRHSPLHAGHIPNLASGRADDDSLPESSFDFSRRRRGCEEEEREEFLARGQHHHTSAVCNGFNSAAVGSGGEGGGWWHRTYERGASAEAPVSFGGVPACCCPARWCESPSSCKRTAEGNRRLLRRREAGDTMNVLHANRRSCDECAHAHRCCITADAREHHGRDTSRGGHGSVTAAAAAAAGVKATAARAPDGVGDGEDLAGGKCLAGSGGPLSLAAVEAWEAAETWASAVAAATGAVAAGGSLSSVETEEGSVGREREGGAAGLGETSIVECDPGRRQSCCAAEAEEGVGVGVGCSSCCRCSHSGGAAGVLDICKSAVHRRDSVLAHGSAGGTGGLCRSVFHRRDSVLCSNSSSKVPTGADLHHVARVPVVAATRGSTAPACPPRYIPTRAPAGSDERSFDAPGRNKGGPSAARPVVAGAAAAIVLRRIDRGDDLWGRRARRAGLEALKGNRARVGRQTTRGATATRFYETALKARGLRALGALASRKRGRGEAAIAAVAAAMAAATAADAFVRAQSLRRVVAMLKR